MEKYIYIGTDKELIENGFEITKNTYDVDDLETYDCFEAIRRIDEKSVLVLQDKTHRLELSYYDEVYDSHTDKSVELYVQDLIGKELVKKIN